jgi:hypothetical protein
VQRYNSSAAAAATKCDTVVASVCMFDSVSGTAVNATKRAHENRHYAYHVIASIALLLHYELVDKHQHIQVALRCS